MDSKINQRSALKKFPKCNSVIDEINRGKEYSKLLEQRQIAVPINSLVSGHKDKPKSDDAKIQVTTKSDPVKQDDESKSGKILVSAKSDQVGKIIDQTKPNPAIQVDKAKPGQIDQNTTTTSADVPAQIKSDTKPVELYQQLYPDVYVERTIVPEYQPNYEEIPRVTRNIIRDTLSLTQHMNLLAQPKVVKQRPVQSPYVVRRKVPGPSPRIIQLARSKRRQTLETCNRFGATMEQFCVENCHRNVQDVTFVPVHDDVYFIELNKRRPIVEKEKLKLRMKRLQEKINEAKMAKTKDILRTLYSSLKKYLMPPASLSEKKPTECADCAKGLCAGCSKIDGNSDDAGTDDQQADGGIVDDETKKLSLVFRRKMEKLLSHEQKIEQVEQGSHWQFGRRNYKIRKLCGTNLTDSAIDANVTKLNK